MNKELLEIDAAHIVLTKLALNPCAPKLALAFKKCLLSIKPAHEVFTERKQALLEEFGKQNGNQYLVEGDNLPLFQEQYKTLALSEVDVTPETIAFALLPDDFAVSGDDLLILDWIIIE